MDREPNMSGRDWWTPVLLGLIAAVVVGAVVVELVTIVDGAQRPDAGTPAEQAHARVIADVLDGGVLTIEGGGFRWADPPPAQDQTDVFYRTKDFIDAGVCPLEAVVVHRGKEHVVVVRCAP